MIVHEIERGALCPVTVVVVSPVFLASPWAQFANQLALHQSIEAADDGSAALAPAIVADCVLPLWHQRMRGLLRLAEYDVMSDGVQTGLAVTVARRANGALNDLSPAGGTLHGACSCAWSISATRRRAVNKRAQRSRPQATRRKRLTQWFATWRTDGWSPPALPRRDPHLATAGASRAVVRAH